MSVVQTQSLPNEQLVKIEAQIQALWHTPTMAIPEPIQPPSAPTSLDVNALLAQIITPTSDRLPFVQLTREALQRRLPNIERHLYGALGLQCHQCGFRYASSTEGQQKYETHLNWHFRQNKKRIEDGGKAHSRDWFLSEEDWLSLTDVDTTREQGL